MKHLFPTITCLLTAHMKPTLGEAIESVLKQTRQDFALIIADSGMWVGQQDEISQAIANAYRSYASHPRIEWVFTGEKPEMNKEVCMVSHVFNECFEAGLIRGKYVCHFYDDDIYHPQFFEKMAGYLENNHNSDIVRCSEQWVVLEGNKEREINILRADGVLTSNDQMDQVVDGGQVLYKREILEKLPKPLMDIRPKQCRHSDGLFFEKMKNVISKMDSLDEILYVHRFTPWSAFTPSSAFK